MTDLGEPHVVGIRNGVPERERDVQMWHTWESECNYLSKKGLIQLRIKLKPKSLPKLWNIDHLMDLWEMGKTNKTYRKNISISLQMYCYYSCRHSLHRFASPSAANWSHSIQEIELHSRRRLQWRHDQHQMRARYALLYWHLTNALISVSLHLLWLLQMIIIDNINYYVTL